MDIKCRLEEKISSKTGKPYICLEISLTDSYKKLVFLKDAEIELIKEHARNTNNK